MSDYIIRLIIEGPEGTSSFVVPAGSITMGRQAGNEIHLNDSMVSRQHARLDCSDTGCTITDLGSANGTFLNEERLAANTPFPLTDKAVIKIGPFRLVYEQTQIVIAAAEPVEPVRKPPARTAEKEKEKEAKKGKDAAATNGHAPAMGVPTMPPSRPPTPEEPDYSEPPPGLAKESDRYLQYLPGIYQNEFMGKFLGMLEAILAPIEWNVDNFDLFLDPKTAPPEFLPWLESWFSIPFDSTWTDEQKRDVVREAAMLYSRRGTRWALTRALEIYTGVKPEIDDQDPTLDDFTFSVNIPLKEAVVKRELVENLINSYKPSHTVYKLSFTG